MPASWPELERGARPRAAYAGRLLAGMSSDMLEPGERMPDFVLPAAADGALARFYGAAGGRPTAVVLPGAADSPAAHAALLGALSAIDDVAAYWLADNRAAIPLGARGFVDAERSVIARLRGDDDRPLVLHLDSNLRLVSRAGDLDGVQVVGALEALREAAEGHTVAAQAPALMIPRVLDDAACQSLIERCRADSVETGVEHSTAGGRQASVDSAMKRRRDVTVTDAAALQHLSRAVGSRIMPEIMRAFAFRATRFEGFKIGWYDESARGFFAPHRDNLTPATAHRVFGLSINLNDDYTGGELSFPEYGGQRYRAPAGAAMVFSCDLMHAVHPVVQGSRFVLLSFLSGT